MAEKKSLVEEALLQMKNLEEVVSENAKGILASTMKEEISELVKESLKKETDEQAEDEMDVEIDSMDDMDDEEGIEIDMDMDDMDMEDEDEFDVEDMEDEMEMDFDMDSEDEQPIDLTNASDEEILKVFKAMGDNDGIIVKKDDGQITLEDENEDSEYIIQLEGDMEDEIMDEEDMEEEMYEEDMEEYEMKEEMSDEDLDNVMSKIFAEEDMEEEMYEEDMYDSEMEEEEDMEEGDVVYEITMDDEMEEEDDESVNENKFTIKPKMGSLTKSSLTNKAKKMETKESSMMTKPVVGKGVKTGSAKFEYKEGKKMETKEASIEPKGRAKGVGMNLSPKKFEYKEGYGMNKGDKSKTHKGDEDYTTKKGDTLKRKAFEKEETTEAARTLSNGTRNYPMRKGLPKMKVKPNSALSEEVVRLREKNEEYRKALNVFREKLNEVAVFNSNLAYATRLFTEHTTTKQEKINILRRFDDVESLKESKSLYGSIKNELSNNKNQSVVTESMSRIEKSPASGSAQNLIESKTYENPQFLRMKDIMSKIAK
jgi:hypothetical protein